jgi:hypothetical protein
MVPPIPSALQIRERICDIEVSAPPTSWHWPREGDAIQVMASATDDEPAFWRPARIFAVLADGWLGAEMLLPEGEEAWPDGSAEWQDVQADGLNSGPSLLCHTCP